MAGNRIEFSLFGKYDDYDVFRSHSPFTSTTLPSPLITGLTIPYFVDTSIIIGVRYYYMIRVKRGDVYQFSDLFNILSNSSYVELEVSGNQLIDLGSGEASWVNNNVALNEPNVLNFNGSTNTFLSTTKVIDFNRDFEISCYAKSVQNSFYFNNIFMNTFNTWSGGTLNLGFGTPSNNDGNYDGRIYFNTAYDSVGITYPYSFGIEYLIQLRAQSNTISLIVNGSVVGTRSRFPFGTYERCVIGAWMGANSQQQMVGTIRNFTIKYL